jgi:hypothetical protein
VLSSQGFVVTALKLLTNVGTPRRSYVNFAPSNAITNTSTETAFDPTYTVPDQNSFSLPPHTTIRMRAWGVISTGVLNLGLTLRIRWGNISGTVIASSGGITVAGLLSDGGWWMESVIILRTPAVAGTAECQYRQLFNEQRYGQ